MPEARDPRLFIDGLTLRRYQRQALAWMIDREKKRYVTEESCTGLSVGGVGGSPAAEGGAASAGDTSLLAVEYGGGGGASGEERVLMRDGCVRVVSWEGSATNGGGDADCGGGAGVAMHPLWERRAAASRVVPQAAAAASTGSIFDSPEVELDGETSSAAGGEESALLAQPEAFYVNVYSRRFQREFPPASLGCRGGILADEMGMGKTVMLLALILSDKERRQDEEPQQDGGEDYAKDKSDDDDDDDEDVGGAPVVGDGPPTIC
ncbi:unnamed protein product, partial [Hapterophycus canaliculatus]